MRECLGESSRYYRWGDGGACFDGMHHRDAGCMGGLGLVERNTRGAEQGTEMNDLHEEIQRCHALIARLEMLNFVLCENYALARMHAEAVTECDALMSRLRDRRIGAVLARFKGESIG